MLKKVSRVLAGVALAGSSLLGMAGQAHAADRDVCYRPWVGGIGWMSWQCNGAWAGTTGQARSIYAVEFRTAVGELCLRAHRSNYGWDSTDTCVTPGQTKRIGSIEAAAPVEAIAMYSRSSEGGYVYGDAHVRDIGWVGGEGDMGYYRTGYGEVMYIGTTGRALPMEAFWLKWL